MKTILLGNKQSKNGNNVDNFTNLELSTDFRLLPVESIEDKINAYDEYVKEKDNSDKYRFIFTINPICSNILFNAYSEIVYKEGSEDCKVIDITKRDFEDIEEVKKFHKYKYNASTTTLINKDDVIRDTSYSDKSVGGFVYHCGIDIFNNHFLRKKEFSVINKIVQKNSSYNKNFNTLSDYLRDSSGNLVKSKIVKDGSLRIHSEPYLHLYRKDSLMKYIDAVYNNLIESDGWVGFLNPTTLRIDNYVTEDISISINKCMNNNKAGEQIDMYPDRSLYSFIPKVNKYRNRIEKNWDYCITYPYESIYDNKLVSYNGVNGVKSKILESCRLIGTLLQGNITEKTIEDKIIYLKTELRNTLSKGSQVSITIINKTNGKSSTSEEPINVEGIGYMGEDTNHIFSIKLLSFYMVISLLGAQSENFLDGDGRLKSNYEIRIRKHIKGIDCKYYLRKFRKIPNFNNSNVCLTDDITEEDISNNMRPFTTVLSKNAFEENIYSDKTAQLIFTEDIITTGLKDNLGRSLSELYLTIIKRNKGNNLWYNNHDYTNTDIEFSHCFGNISSGFDLDSDENDYNIHKIHNVENLEVITTNVEHLEKNITSDNVYFYGDIVELSPYEIQETVIENAYHRFNTMQRELNSTVFGNDSGITYEEIVADDYDIGGDNTFSSVTYALNTGSLPSKFIHINPEGYYYKPHYRLLLKEYDKKINQGTHIEIKFSKIDNNNNTYSATTSVLYYLNVGDTLYFYKKNTHEKKTGKVIYVDEKYYTHIVFTTSEPLVISDYFVYKPNPIMPSTAYDLSDGTGRYIWREFKSDRDMIPEDELYDSVFTNGANYRYEKINFYLRRQDSTGEYGLSAASKMDMITGASEGKIKDISSAEYISENQGTIC